MSVKIIQLQFFCHCIVQIKLDFYETYLTDIDMICSFQAIGGNIMTASPISDLNPVLMAARCPLTLAAAGGTPSVWKLLMQAQQCWSSMGCQFLSYEETMSFASPPLDGMPILYRVPQGGIVRGGLQVSTTPSSPPPPHCIHLNLVSCYFLSRYQAILEA